MLIAPVIDFIADYCGLGDLPQLIAEKIKSFQEWILGLIEKALGFLVEKGKALLAAVGIGGKDKEEKKDAKAEDGVAGLGTKVSFSANGEPHTLWIQDSGGIAVMVKSDPMRVEELLAQFEKKLEGRTGTEAESATKKIGEARKRVQETQKEATEEKEKDQIAESNAGEPKSVQAAKQAGDETAAKEQSLGDILGEIFALVHGGVNILDLLDHHIIARDASGGDTIKDTNAVSRMTAAEYVVYAQARDGKDRYYVRRGKVPKADESKRPQVHFTPATESDPGGRLALGPGTAKADDDEKRAVYDTLLGLVGLKGWDEENIDKYRDQARTKIVQKLAKQDAAAIREFMDNRYRRFHRRTIDCAAISTMNG